MQFKPTLRKATELGITFTALTALILAGCGGGSSAGGGDPVLTTSATITPYKGPFAQGAIVTIKDANGNPVTLTTGGTVNASGVVSVTYNQSVAYPLLVEVTGSYFNEITRQFEPTSVPMRSLITTSAGTANVPVTIVTETAVADLLDQVGGSFTAAHPIQAASAVAALDVAGTMFGIPASAVPSFNASALTTSDSNTLALAALAVVANNQAASGTLADKVKALALSMATLNAASAPSDVIVQGDFDAAMFAMTNGASSVASGGVTPPAPIIPATTVGVLNNNAAIAAANSIVGSWHGASDTTMALVFFANGDYMQSLSAVSGVNMQPGLEHGTYTWNSSTGAFSTGGCPAVDTNGDAGMSHTTGNGCGATAGTITVSGNTLTFKYAEVGVPTTIILTRVIDANPGVGTWTNMNVNGVSAGTGNSLIYTFFANGDYMQSQSILSGAGTAIGLEHGTFSLSQAGAFASVCPTVDTNGTGGLSAGTGSQCVAGSGTPGMNATVSASGNTLTVINNLTPGQIITFDRVMP